MKQTKPVLSRRNFLQQSAVVAGAVALPTLIPASVLGANGAVAPSNRITVATVGAGGRGRGIMSGFLDIDQARVVAVCDTYADRQQKAKDMVDKKYGNKDCKMYGDFREVIARSDVDAVHIAAQDHWHALLATAAANAGKHLYCEKPLGVCYRDCQIIRDTVRKTKIIFQTGTQQRSDRKFRKACELALNGYLGTVHTVEVGAPGPQYQPKYKGSLEPQPVPAGFDWKMWRGPAPEKPYNEGRVAWPDWYLINDYCTGFIVNWGVHHLDIASWGTPTFRTESFEVECQATYRKEGFTDNVNGWKGSFTFAQGPKLLYSDPSTYKSGVKFIGDKGWVHVDRPSIESGPESLLDIKLKDSDLHLPESDNHPLDFIKAVIARKQPIADVEAGFQASYLGMLADISARLNKKLKWDVKQEKFVGADDANAMLVRPLYNGWQLKA